jgi:hypothetical protein
MLIYNDCSPEKTGRPPVFVPVIFLFPSCYSPVNAAVKVTFPDWACDRPPCAAVIPQPPFNGKWPLLRKQSFHFMKLNGDLQLRMQAGASTAWIRSASQERTLTY